MGTILASLVLSKAQLLIQDRTGVHWPADEMLGWINSGQRQIVLLRPDACSETVLHQLATGTKQGLPTGGIRLLNVMRNMGTDGDTPGRAITFVKREVLDSQMPNWHFENPNATVRHFFYDDVEPRTWYCWPPQPSAGRGQVHLVVSKVPTPCTIEDVPKEDGSGNGTETTPISVDDIYENPLIDYCVFRAQSKDAEFASGPLAQLAWNMFLQSLGLRSATDKAFAAVNNAPPRVTPNMPAPTGAFTQ
jgi:hypothetical protein